MQTLTFQSTLAHARALAQLIGPLAQAEDATENGLACAQVNAELLKPGWCDCKAGPTEEVYFRRAGGGHGFMCADCWRVTQSG